MDIRLIEPDVLFAFLPAEPGTRAELALLRSHLKERDSLHLIIDLSRVEIISSPSIGGLLFLRKMQAEREVKLLLCQMHLATRCVLRVVGLDTVFECVTDKAEALRVIHQGAGTEKEVLQKVLRKTLRQSYNK